MGRSDRHHKKYEDKRREAFRYGESKHGEFTPEIMIRSYDSHPRFPKAIAVFSATAQKSFDAPEQTHLIVISHRTVPREEHEKNSSPEELTHLHSQALGGVQGNFSAYLYRGKFTEDNTSDRRYISTSKDEVFTRLKELLERRTVEFEHPELHRLVHRMKL